MSDLISQLKVVLADTYSLYLQTQNFHWNVKGERFFTLHTFYQQQYEEYAEAIDIIAEHIRTFGEYAPGTFQEMVELSSIEQIGTVQGAPQMTKTLLEQTDEILASIRQLQELAEEEGDQATLDLAVERERAHTKWRWMLAATLEG